MNKFDEFFKKYSLIADEEKQKEFLLSFMLALTPEELVEFTMDNIKTLKEDRRHNKLPKEEIARLNALLDKGIGILQTTVGSA